MMTTPKEGTTMASTPLTRVARFRRAVALAMMLSAPAALNGCALGLVAHHSDREPPQDRTGGSGSVSELVEVREKSAAQPAEPYWPYRMGELWLASDSLPQAEAALKASLARDGTYAPALALLSKLYYRTGRHEEAVRLLEPVRSRADAFPADARQSLLAGLALHQQALGRPDLAGVTLAEVLPAPARDAGSAVVYVLLCGDRPDSALAPAAAAVRADPRSAVNQNNYGITRLRVGDPMSARRAFLASIDRDPGLPGPYYNLAILEKFYLFEDDDASRWFDAYWKRSHADPDSLLGVFAGGSQKPLVQKGN
jgi:tetratricopeptide (TPR) repeat protein